MKKSPTLFGLCVVWVGIHTTGLIDMCGGSPCRVAYNMLACICLFDNAKITVFFDIIGKIAYLN